MPLRVLTHSTHTHAHTYTHESNSPSLTIGSFTALCVRLAVADADFIARLQEAGGVERLRALATCDVLQIVQVANACLHNVSEALAAAASKTAQESTDRKVAAQAKAAAAAASRDAARSGVALAEAEASRLAVPVAASPSPTRRAHTHARRAVTFDELGSMPQDPVYEIAIDLTPSAVRTSAADLGVCTRWWRWPWRKSSSASRFKGQPVAVQANEDRFPAPRLQATNEGAAPTRQNLSV